MTKRNTTTGLQQPFFISYLLSTKKDTENKKTKYCTTIHVFTILLNPKKKFKFKVTIFIIITITSNSWNL